MALKTNIVAPIGGILILAGGLALAAYTGTQGTQLVQARAKAIQKYVALSEKALAQGDLKAAEKHAKAALAVDPKNRSALAEYKKVLLASCPKAPATAPVTQSATPASPAAPAATPAKPEAEPEEEMGCI